MQKEHEAIRRELGQELIDAEREEQQRHPPAAVADPSKPVVINAIKPELLPNGVTYFSSFEDFERWCDSDGGATD